MPQEQYESLSEANKKLYNELVATSNEKSQRVNQFLATNPNVSRYIRTSSGNTATMTDVIDGKPQYTATYNNEAALATRTSDLQVGGALGLDLDGTGMTVGVWDGGAIQIDHPEFAEASGSASRVLNKELENTDGSFDLSSHGTHVTGTISAKGVNPAAKGMATNVNVFTYNFLNDTPEMLTEITSLTSPIILSNHSYGLIIDFLEEWRLGAYTGDASQVDQIARNNPKYLMVVSAGNDGFFVNSDAMAPGLDKLTGVACAKNNLVIGNAAATVFPFNGELTSLSISGGSTQGPTDDLRVKPDIAAVGTGVFSTFPGGTYGNSSGTSMSAPNTTGTLVLLQQYYEQLHGVYMNASTLKGLVCHTALEDFDTFGPDPRFGWGFLDARAAAELITGDTNGSAILDEQTLLNGQTYVTTFSAVEGEKLSATICWTDVRGVLTIDNDSNNTASRLVNDLDIRLTKDGVDYLPWKLELNGTSVTSTKGDNTADNVERIDIEAPETGTYTLTVSHKGTLQGATPFEPQEQDFSLIVSGKNISLSVDDVSVFDSKLWPNPTRDVFNLSFEPVNNLDITLTMIDLQGRVVYNKTLDVFDSRITETIDVSNLANGSYILSIKQGSSISNSKVIKY
ncbi:S8 family serine peptidase [uncultured Psychroserpens sp.]|uniref:S8 family serine peptidase n=1 Tax=uncultured Psychroserpens sp. TaxID=255436 RepID=UPI0026124185|nr:S8 family serine peptidase [uncultured Psychroserpens sp.]